MRKRDVLIVLGSLLAMILGPATISAAQVNFAEAGVYSSATGTVLHADALRNAGTRLLDVEVAFSGASFNSGGLASSLRNEFERPFAPVQTGKTAQALGVGLEVGLGITPDTENQGILAGRAVSVAPPTTAAVTNLIGPVDLDPLAWAALLKGYAMSDSRTDGVCTLGGDLGRGLGYVADLQLLETDGDAATTGLDAPLVALDANGENSAVSQSASRTLLVSQRGIDGRPLGPNFGILSEVRQSIAPVTLFEGTPNQFTIEFLAEWVLQSTASGVPGGAFIHYGPDVSSPDTPVIRILDDTGTETRVLTMQDLLTDQGLVVTIPGLLELVIGEDPRAIGGDADSEPAIAADGTAASAAVDVVRVVALPGVAMSVEDLRIGHMEVRSQVPAGGVSCPIPVVKTVTPASITVGNGFLTTITVTNPYDCELTNIRLTDVITTEDGARFTVLSTDPAATSIPTGDELSSGTLVWNNVGSLDPGESLSVAVRLGARGTGGRILDTASAAATVGACAGQGSTVAGVGVGAAGGTVQGLSASAVQRVLAATVVKSAALPATGAGDLMTLAVGGLLAGFAVAGLYVNKRRRPA